MSADSSIWVSAADLGPRGELVDEPARHAGREQRLAGGDDPDRFDELGRVGVFEQETARARPQCFVDVLVELERGQHQDAWRVGAALDYATRGFEPIHHRHPDVHQDHVGARLGSELDRLLTVLGLANHLDTARLKQHAEAGTNESLVVCDERLDLSRCISCQGDPQLAR